ncbi:MAG: hypothetical protein JXB39_13835 [Deltaproteobacteria bacterium]|nr:hypothetical protein [Deltaproteobacteria bacterium]
MRVRDVLDARLLFVTGKGGTGKTTVALALARLAASEGRRVVLVEVDSHRPTLASWLDLETAYGPVPAGPGLDVANVTWLDALVDWLTGIVPVQRIVRLILTNRMVHLFLDVTPGSREVVLLARIEALLGSYDQVVVDLPAAGHAVSFLKVPQQSASLFPSGPLRRTLDGLVLLLSRPDTQVVLTALPEEMVVNETVETWVRLTGFRPSLALPLVVLNKALPPDPDPQWRADVRRVAARHKASHPAGAVLQAGLWEAEREELTADALDRLSREIRARVVLVPLVDELPGPLERVGHVEAVLGAALSDP